MKDKYGDKWEEVLADAREFFRNEREEHVKQYVGKRSRIELSGLLIDVIVNDVKVTFAGNKFQVTPLNGSKNIWVDRIIN